MGGGGQGARKKLVDGRENCKMVDGVTVTKSWFGESAMLRRTGWTVLDQPELDRMRLRYFCTDLDTGDVERLKLTQLRKKSSLEGEKDIEESRSA